jgi:hypothetical protein
MHTIGHPSESGPGMTGHGAAMTGHGATSMPPADRAEAGDAGPARGWQAYDPGERMVMDPRDVCVAVLVSGLLLLLAALLTWVRRAPSGQRPATTARLRSGRGPPVPRLGLRLADLSVWRT